MSDSDALKIGPGFLSEPPEQTWVSFTADGGAWAYHFTKTDPPESTPPKFSEEQLDWLREHVGLDDDDLAPTGATNTSTVFQVPTDLLAEYGEAKRHLYSLERQIMNYVPRGVRTAWGI